MGRILERVEVEIEDGVRSTGTSEDKHLEEHGKHAGETS
jgi:hypothetical protein